MKIGLFSLVVTILVCATVRLDALEPLPSIQREILVRPEDINVNVRQQEFQDTTLNLKANSNIRIVIKVKNGKFLNLFA